METIKPAKRAQLHEVADLMLEIYKTLARMRYLDSSCIQEGPHNIDDLLPLYRSLGIHDSIIYLYSILPYVDTGATENVDFFQGGTFADFRRRTDVERGRDPLCDDRDTFPPQMTPLSLLGNHQSVILYNSRTHCISIIDQESDGSTDHNLYGGEDNASDVHEDEDVDRNVDGDMDENQDEAEAEDGDENDDDDGDDDDDDEDDDDSYSEDGVEEYPSRPAGNVLRDIVKWYRDLVELPGGGEQSEDQWKSKAVRRLYKEHGWPHAHFDGHAFLVDLARAYASEMAKYDIEEPTQQIHTLEYNADYENTPHVRQQRENIAAAKTVEEEWVARYRLRYLQRLHRPDMEELRRVKEERDNIKYEELPLYEVKRLRMELQWRERKLERLREEARESKGGSSIEGRLRHAEEKVEILQAAYSASLADADRLFPGWSTKPAPDPGVEEVGRLERTRDELARNTEKVKAEMKLLHDWESQVPTSASEAKKLAQDELKSMKKLIEAYLDQSREVVESLEKHRPHDGR